MTEMSLKEWYLENHGNFNILWGRVISHTRFEDGDFIHTSSIKTLVLNEKDKSLNFFTVSGSNYRVAFEDIDYRADFIEKTRDSFCNLKFSTSFIDEAIILSKRKERVFKKVLVDELLNGDLYLELGEYAIIRAYFKYNDKVLRLYERCHVGTLVDSYLYTISGVV